MKLVADTPLRTAWRPWCFAPGDWRLVVVVKATLDLPRDGIATLAEEQAFVTGDAFWDDDPERSIRYDDDLALLKPQGEWWITGTLRATEPARELACLARVGDRELRFDVIGDRWWQPDGSMSPPEPFTEMPLAWERSFGGPGFAANPLGRGVAPDPLDPQGRVALPNIERHSRLIRWPSERPEPAGAWPVPRSWPERTRFMGTYDGAYLRERWPYFAADFSWRHFQAARDPQRITGYWRGDEEIELAHLHPVHPHLRCRLPSIKPRALVHECTRAEGPLREVGLVLDTIAIDAGEGRAFAIWRGSTPCSGEAFEVDFAHLYVTHEPLGQPRSESEYLGAFVARLRALWEEENAYEAEGPVAEPSSPASAPPRVEPEVERYSPEQVLEQQRASARELGWPDAVIEQLYRPVPPAADPSVQRAALEGARGTAERLGLPSVVEVLGRALEALAFDQPSDGEQTARREPPPGLWSPQELRDQVSARLSAGESLAGLVLAEADLSLLDLSGRDLSGAVLVRADLRGANFNRARLDGATLDGAKLDGATFREASLRGAALALVEGAGVDFSGADLEDAVVERAVLPGALFCGVKGDGLAFDECLAEAADFSSASLVEAELTRSNLDESCFRGATLTDARLDGASLRRACLDHVDAVKVRAAEGADLSEARVRWARLHEATFARGVLIGVRMAESDLTRASFVEARLEGAELLAVKARGASFSRASMGGASLAGADLLGARFEGTSLPLADLRGANLYGAELWRADVTNARLDGANVEGTKLA